MNVVLVGELNGFPRGMAASSYFMLESRGLVRAGAGVHVIPFYYPVPEQGSCGTRGAMYGVSWEYLGRADARPSGRLQRLALKMKTERRLPGAMRRAFDGEGPDIVIFFGRSFDVLSRCAHVTRQLGVPFAVQLIEWPSTLPKGSSCQRFNDWLFCRRVARLGDVFIVISSFLEEQLSATLRKSGCPMVSPVHYTPILADTAVWESVERPATEVPYVLYCASMNAYIEDALFTVKAFAEAKLPGYDLVMLGPASASVQKRIRQHAEQCGVDGNVKLRTNYHTDEALRELHVGASALLAPLSNDERSRARFPSKVASYLMAGQPVVSSTVGEVVRHLEDGKTAFLAAPDDCHGFARKIHDAVFLPEREQVRLAGQAVARRAFDYEIQGKRLFDFLHMAVAKQAAKEQA